MKTQVVKRDGTLEDYDEAKVTKVVEACGLEPAKAQAVAANITKWMKDNNLSKVTSLQIRDALLADLKISDGPAAALYLWYEDSKDVSK